MDSFAWDSHTPFLCMHPWAPAAVVGKHVQTHVCRCTCSAPTEGFGPNGQGIIYTGRHLESAVRLMQLKHFPLGKHAETWYARPWASEALRGSWRVQEVASTLPLCPHPAAPPGAFRQPGSITRDGLFLSILRRGYVYKVTFNVSTSLWGSSHTPWTVPELCLEVLVGQIYFYIPTRHSGLFKMGGICSPSRWPTAASQPLLTQAQSKQPPRVLLQPSSEGCMPFSGAFAGTAKAAVWHRGPTMSAELSHSRVCWVTTDTRAFVSSDCRPLRQEGKHLKPDKFHPLQTNHLFLHPCHRWGSCWLAPFRGAKLQRDFWQSSCVRQSLATNAMSHLIYISTYTRQNHLFSLWVESKAEVLLYVHVGT